MREFEFVFAAADVRRDGDLHRFHAAARNGRHQLDGGFAVKRRIVNVKLDGLIARQFSAVLIDNRTKRIAILQALSDGEARQLGFLLRGGEDRSDASIKGKEHKGRRNDDDNGHSHNNEEKRRTFLRSERGKRGPIAQSLANNKRIPLLTFFIVSVRGDKRNQPF